MYTRDEVKLQEIFTGEREARSGASSGGAGDGVELRLDPLEELHGLVDRSRQLLPVLDQHVAVRLLLIHRFICHPPEKRIHNYAVVGVGNDRDEHEP
jgi:hypothetical protein